MAQRWDGFSKRASGGDCTVRMASNSGILIPPPAPTSTVASTNDIRPLKPPVPVPNPWLWVFWSVGILLMLAVIGAAVALWLRAKQKLDAALLLIGDPRAFCIAVSDAMRAYLEERFDLRAPERTTEEFLRDLQKTLVLTSEQKLSLATFLEQCDLVKFARFEPPETLLRELHESALRLVHETQYVAEQPGTSVVPTPGAQEIRQQDAGGTLPK